MFINKKMVWVIGCSFLMLSGCSSSKKDVQQASVNEPKKASNIKDLYIQFNAEKSPNIDKNNHPLSVMIRVYQLKDKNAFIQSNYKDLIKDNNINVKQDTLIQYDIPLKPTDKILLHRPLETDTIYIGVAAFFKQPDLQKNNWKFIIRRDSLFKKKPRIIEVNTNALSLKLTKKELKKQGKK